MCFSRPQAQEAAIDDGDADAASPYEGECHGTRFPLDLPRLGIGDDGLLARGLRNGAGARSEEHTSELQSLMRISYAVFCLKKKNTLKHVSHNNTHQNNKTITDKNTP